MYYKRLGEVPPKRHTKLLGPGGQLRYEQVITTHGFDHRYACLYHVHPPTRVSKVIERGARPIEVVSGIFLGQTATQFWAFPQS